MRCFISPFTDVFANLATEEYLLKNSDEEYFMIWRSQPCLVVGKHQNTLSEINFQYVNQNNIAVARRLSGGGTVYHDEGNINFTFIKNGLDGNLVNFRGQLEPVIDTLQLFGVVAVFGGHNSLLVNGLKISGNAEHVFKRRVLHHGTLLFNANLEALENAIQNVGNHYSDKAVKSVRATVTNLNAYISNSYSIADFTELFFKKVTEYFNETPSLGLNFEEIHEIEKLVKNKYILWSWNFGYSPHYVFKRQIGLEGSFFNALIEVERGIILNVHFSEFAFNYNFLVQFSNNLKGQPHDYFQLIKLFVTSEPENRLKMQYAAILEQLF